MALALATLVACDHCVADAILAARYAEHGPGSATQAARAAVLLKHRPLPVSFASVALGAVLPFE
jgi:hypothetical protein